MNWEAAMFKALIGMLLGSIISTSEEFMPDLKSQETQHRRWNEKVRLKIHIEICGIEKSFLLFCVLSQLRNVPNKMHTRQQITFHLWLVQARLQWAEFFICLLCSHNEAYATAYMLTHTKMLSPERVMIWFMEGPVSRKKREKGWIYKHKSIHSALPSDGMNKGYRDIQN